jgi:hypothetical protein
VGKEVLHVAVGARIGLRGSGGHMHERWRAQARTYACLRESIVELKLTTLELGKAKNQEVD